MDTVCSFDSLPEGKKLLSLAGGTVTLRVPSEASAVLAEASRTSEEIIRACSSLGLTVSSAESCTGGWISKLLTDVPGASSVLSGAAVTYTNAMKEKILGVSPALIASETEYSFACAEAMAKGIRRSFESSFGVSTTGFAGPAGGTPRDPVGTVYLGLSSDLSLLSFRLSVISDGKNEVTRDLVRLLASLFALKLLAASVDGQI